MTADTVLRILVFLSTPAAAGELVASMVLRLRARPRRLTRGQFRGQLALLLFLMSAWYAVGESLFGWFHLRLWLLGAAAVFAVVGCGGMLADALDERRHPTG